MPRGFDNVIQIGIVKISVELYPILFLIYQQRIDTDHKVNVITVSKSACVIQKCPKNMKSIISIYDTRDTFY